ncbi:MAG: hypothetical protein MZV63_34520 [Marinilabiliales bacterium]|nr:hypothetical protein [Marinilabiliales bacterium]
MSKNDENSLESGRGKVTDVGVEKVCTNHAGVAGDPLQEKVEKAVKSGGRTEPIHVHHHGPVIDRMPHGCAQHRLNELCPGTEVVVHGGRVHAGVTGDPAHGDRAYPLFLHDEQRSEKDSFLRCGSRSNRLPAIPVAYEFPALSASLEGGCVLTVSNI